MKKNTKRTFIAVFAIATIAFTLINLAQGHNILVSVAMAMLSAAMCCVLYQVGLTFAIVLGATEDEEKEE